MKSKTRLLIGAGVAAWLAAGVCAQSYSISTVAGSDRRRDGMPAAGTPLNYPIAAVVDRNGNLFIADSADNLIRKVTPAGTIDTYAGTGSSGFAGDGGPANRASFNSVRSLAVDAAGNLYVADSGNYRVRKIDSAGMITTIAGTGKPSFGVEFPDGGPAKSSVITPQAVAVDAKGNVYVSDVSTWFAASGAQFDTGMHFAVRKIDPAGIITTVTGSGARGYSGDGGPATQARVTEVTGIAVDAAGNLYLCDSSNYRLRKVTPDGVIATVAGTGKIEFSGDGGPATAASLHPWGATVDANGDIYVVDKANNRVRKIDGRTGTIATVAGIGNPGFSGDGGPARSAALALPSTVSLDAAGTLYIADSYNCRIRSISRDGTINTVAGAPVGDGGPATRAFLNYPVGIAVDPAGNLFIADTANNRIRKVDFTGTVGTIAGFGYNAFSDGGGRAANALFSAPSGVALDLAGNLYIADAGNYRIRKVTPGGAISTFAGTGKEGFSGDGGQATSADIGVPLSVAVDASGNLFFADYTENRIRKVTPAGIIGTVAGNGEWRTAGDGGPATRAQLSPFDVAVDAAGNVFVADPDNHCIRKIDSAGIISTVAGTGTPGMSGDGGPAKSANLHSPSGVALDGNGNLYIADSDNLRVRLVTKDGLIATVAGNGHWPIAGDGGPATAAQLDPLRVAVDARGNVFVSDALNSRIRLLQLRVPAAASSVAGDGQSGTVGQAASQPLTVRILDSGGAPVPGVTVTFSVTSGTATLSPTQAVTGPEGEAKTIVTFGAVPGNVVVTARAGNLPPVTFRLTARVPVPAPQITAGGVTGAGGSVPPVQALSPNGLATIAGANFAAAGTSRQAGDGDLVDGRLPTKLAGVCVLVGQSAAPVLSVQPNKVTFQAPRLQAADTVEVRVAVNCGTADEVRSGAEWVSYLPAAPEFVYFTQSADGRNPVKARNEAAGTNVGKPGLLPDGTFAPARPGDVLTLYVMGLGLTDPPFAAGEFPAGRASVTGKVEIRIGETTLAPADVRYTGVAPASAGIYLAEIHLPDDCPDGDLPVAISIDGFASPPGGFITVER